jgi:phosphosulfolactate synthase (CoM biosynthesis protein A)
VYGACIKDAKKVGFNELSISNKMLKIFGKSKVKIIKDFLKEEAILLFIIWKKQKNRKAY